MCPVLKWVSLFVFWGLLVEYSSSESVSFESFQSNLDLIRHRRHKFVNLTFFWNFWFRIFALVDIKEEVLHTEGFGKIRVDSDMQVNEETLFNLASNSKLFTSVYAAWVRLVYSRTDRQNLNLTLRRPLRKKLQMRWFFDVSKVKESSFFKSDLI